MSTSEIKPFTVEQHIHVDNGGYTFSVSLGEDHVKSIRISDGYYGYSNHEMTFYEGITPENLRKIADVFLVAAREIEKPR